ncbi:MAG: hypothetical protein JXC33_07965 [Deltaproteobacteria bacterium]|nr:hypothetical protein [Deltaproteobacteria bacterium]
MSIRLYTGIPGSGKTYRVVYELLSKEIQDKYFIIHNIEGLKHDKFINKSHIKSFGQNGSLSYSTDELFTYEVQKELSEQVKQKYNKSLLMVVDECDKLGFDMGSASIKEWLSMHRHIGQDIYLITQNRANIHRSLYNLVEVEILGKRGFIFNQFIYAWLANGEKFHTDRLPKKKEIFEAYKSFQLPETAKKKSNLWRFMAVMGIAGFIGMGYFIFFMMPGEFKEAGQKKDQKLSGTAIIKSDNAESFVPDEYFWGGIVNGKPVYIDKYGNLFKNFVVNSGQIYFVKSDIREVTILNEDTGVAKYKNTYIKDSGRVEKRGGLSQRETTSGIAGASKYKECWVEVK